MKPSIYNLLKKVLPILLETPEIMTGYDISTEEIRQIGETEEILFDVLAEVAWDNFFECCYDDLGITYKKGLELREYLLKLRYNEKELKELKEKFPFIK